jgi:hypothetical protein
MQSAFLLLMAYQILVCPQLFHLQATYQSTIIVMMWHLNAKNCFPPNVCRISIVYLAPRLNAKMPILLGAESFSHMSFQASGNRNPGFKFD